MMCSRGRMNAQLRWAWRIHRVERRRLHGGATRPLGCQENGCPRNFAQRGGEFQERPAGLFLVAELDDVNAAGDGGGHPAGQLVRRANAPVGHQAQGGMWQVRSHGDALRRPLRAPVRPREGCWRWPRCAPVCDRRGTPAMPARRPCGRRRHPSRSSAGRCGVDQHGRSANLQGWRLRTGDRPVPASTMTGNVAFFENGCGPLRRYGPARADGEPRHTVTAAASSRFLARTGSAWM